MSEKLSDKIYGSDSTFIQTYQIPKATCDSNDVPPKLFTDEELKQIAKDLKSICKEYCRDTRKLLADVQVDIQSTIYLLDAIMCIQDLVINEKKARKQ